MVGRCSGGDLEFESKAGRPLLSPPPPTGDMDTFVVVFVGGVLGVRTVLIYCKINGVQSGCI